MRSWKALLAAIAAVYGAGAQDNSTGPRVPGDAGQTRMCAAGQEPRTDSSFWNGWGADAANTRSQTAEMAGLTATDVPKLALAWEIRLPGVNALTSQPVLVGGRLYLGSANGVIYALQAASGCAEWTFRADVPVRTALSMGTNRHARSALFFGDDRAQAYSIDAKSGKTVWKTRVDERAGAVIAGSPVLYGNRLYVPVAGADGQGAVVALDNESGKVEWKAETEAAVRSAPALDVNKRLLYVNAGGVLALALDTGRVAWKRPLKTKGGDVAAEVAPVLHTLEDGSRLLLVGQSPGFVVALDPDAGGRQVWATRTGGVRAGMAVGGGVLYVGASKGLAAVRLRDGKKLWSAGAGVHAAAPFVIPGAVFSGSMDGKLWAFSERDGAPLWSFDTRSRTGGGSIHGSAAIVAQGIVVAQSGFGLSGGLPGNVVLAFTAAAR
ncbi:MAG: PQQ-binding-like beta-propeller repeat protein [Bryobacterales bacterium]|nr:PQQ-binding-like beta-propeller repeat protein [Bryobacterales bacterium]